MLLVMLDLSRSSGSMVLSRTVQVIFDMCFALGLSGFWREAGTRLGEIFNMCFALNLSGFSREARTRLGEIDERCCFSWLGAAESVRLGEGSGSIRGNLLPLTDQNEFNGTLSVMIGRKSFPCLLCLTERLCEVDRGRGIRKRDG